MKIFVSVFCFIILGGVLYYAKQKDLYSEIFMSATLFFNMMILLMQIITDEIRKLKQ